MRKMIENEGQIEFSAPGPRHAQELVIEAAWGMGETVVEGLVIPDSICMNFEGHVIEKNIGI